MSYLSVMAHLSWRSCLFSFLILAPVSGVVPPLRAQPTRDAGSAGARTITRVRLEDKNGPAIGPPDAPITVVEFIDYQCPNCARAHSTVAQILKKYGDRVRLVYRQNPLSIHKDARLAAEAALAAADMGKFRQMHDLLAGNPTRLEREHLLGYARQIGLDEEAFAVALDSGAFREVVDADRATLTRIGGDGTPHFFVNGRSLVGNQPLASFEKIIDEELAGNLEPTRWVSRIDAKGDDAKGDTVARIELNSQGAPTLGPLLSRVMVVAFIDYQCVSCAEAYSTLEELRKKYFSRVRFVYRQRPKENHEDAQLAAEAVLIAHFLKKFQQMHSLLLKNPTRLSREHLLDYGRELGLSRVYEQALSGRAFAGKVEADTALAARIGASGSPHFFINGRSFPGTSSLDRLEEVILEELSGNVKPTRRVTRVEAPEPTPTPGPIPKQDPDQDPSPAPAPDPEPDPDP